MHDDAEQMKEAVLKNAGGDVLKNFSYRYDQSGNRTKVLENEQFTQWQANHFNQLTTTVAGGTMPVRFAGTTNERSDVTVNTQVAGTNSLTWEKELELASGMHTISVVATETTGIVPGTVPQSTTNQYTYTLAMTETAARTLEYDLNGSLTLSSIAGQPATSYEWDEANRLKAVVRAGTPVKRTEFRYDQANRWTSIVEKEDDTVVGSREVIWEGHSIAQIRIHDATGTETERRTFHGGGEVRTGPAIGAVLLVSTADHLGNVRELLDTTGTVQARYDYDPYGKRTKLSGPLDSDFGYTGHYEHPATGLTLAPFRAYDSVLGRWISRDPIEDGDGTNLYRYFGNGPVTGVDPLGLWNAWNPATWFSGADFKGLDSLNPVGKSAHWEAMDSDTFGQSCQATLDGIIPFGDPFLNGGGYDPNDSGLAFSKWAAGLSRDIYTGRLVSGLFAAGKNSLFWTGGQRVGIGAEAVASARGATLLNETLGGRALEAIGRLLPDKVAAVVMKPFWAFASANYAANSVGPATLVCGPASRGMIWSFVERPILWLRGLW